MSQKLKEKILIENGWYLYEGLWVHPKLTSDPILFDYRNYGMSLENALEFEKNGS